MISNWADADEILQETNVRLWNERSKFARGTDFGAWACTIAHFEILNYRNRLKRDRVLFTDQFLDVVASEMENDDTAARYGALEKCIEKLSATNAQMLRAFYQPGAVGKDVAVQFARSVEALYKAMSRIRKVLHDCIQRQIYEGT